jgi:hypothetical protein
MTGLSMPAAADQLIQGTGTFSRVSATVISSWSADGNTFTVVHQVNQFQGIETGINVIDYTIVNHPTGQEELYGTGTFIGEIEGIGTGTYDFSFNASGPASGVFSGQATVLSGTGDFAELHGVVQFQSPPPTYSAMFVNP